MPAAIFAGLFLILLGIGLWASRSAWRSARILALVARTPAVDVAAGGAGVVKIRGEAQPADPENHYPVLWQDNRRSWGGGLRTSTTMFVPIAVHTPSGDCIVDMRRAEVMPTRVEIAEEMFSRDQYTVDKEIRRGDPVFAIGRLRPLRAAPGGAGGTSVAACELRPSWGLMLLSGAVERHVSIYYGMWLAVQLPLAVVCLLLAIWGGRIHLGMYPATPPGVRASFLEALRNFPLENDPGGEIEMRREQSEQSIVP